MSRVLISLKRLACFCFLVPQQRFLVWTRPQQHSLLLGTVTDLFRSKSQVVAENALLRQQLLILRKQVKRPACTRADRMVLVLLA